MMKPVISNKIKLLAMGLAVFVAGCSTQAERFKGYGSQVYIEPEVSIENSFSHQINFGNELTLSGNQKAALQNFLYQAGVRYGDELYYEFAPNDPNLASRKAALDDYLKTIGVWAEGYAQSGSNSNPGSVVVHLNRYQATTPDCLALSSEYVVPGSLEDDNLYGCITAQNFAAHVANKRDIIRGQGDAIPTTQTAIRAMQLYRSRIGQILRIRRGGSVVSTR